MPKPENRMGKGTENRMGKVNKGPLCSRSCTEYKTDPRIVDIYAPTFGAASYIN